MPKRSLIRKIYEGSPLKIRVWLYYAKKGVLRTVYKAWYSFKYGFEFRNNSSDIDVFHEVFITEEFKLGATFKAEVIIDCGAYVGYSSAYFAMKYPSAKIYAIEPAIENYIRLVEMANKFPNIMPIHAAVWPTRSEIQIRAGEGEWAYQVFENGDGDQAGGSIGTITMDEIVALSGKEQIDILKVDIEGAEIELFGGGATKWLEKVNVLIVELHDRIRPGCGLALRNAVSKFQWNEHKKGEKLLFVKKAS